MFFMLLFGHVMEPVWWLTFSWTNTKQASQEVDGKDSDLKDEGPVEWVSYWKPNVTINLVDDFTR